MSTDDSAGQTAAGELQEDRRAALDRIKAAYAQYEATGRDRRWTGDQPGARLAIRERDDWLIAALAPASSGTIVDLGCGDANLALTLTAHGYKPQRYVGIDLIADRLRVARERAPWGEYHLASADALPIDDETADAVVAMTLFSSIPERWFRHSIAREVRRVLRRGGRMVIYDLRYPSPGNAHVAPFGDRQVRSIFAGWVCESRTLTVLPPLSRTWIAAGERRYRLLARLPFLRSHVGAVLIRP
jgi:ubiquinone/menaquinone biosynthesis C-methylase UbiE